MDELFNKFQKLKLLDVERSKLFYNIIVAINSRLMYIGDELAGLCYLVFKTGGRGYTFFYNLIYHLAPINRYFDNNFLTNIDVNFNDIIMAETIFINDDLKIFINTMRPVLFQKDRESINWPEIYEELWDQFIYFWDRIRFLYYMAVPKNVKSNLIPSKLNLVRKYNSFPDRFDLNYGYRLRRFFFQHNIYKEYLEAVLDISLKHGSFALVEEISDYESEELFSSFSNKLCSHRFSDYLLRKIDQIYLKQKSSGVEALENFNFNDTLNFFDRTKLKLMILFMDYNIDEEIFYLCKESYYTIWGRRKIVFLNRKINLNTESPFSLHEIRNMSYRKETHLNELLICNVAFSLVNALEYLENREIYNHADIKPKNLILLPRSGMIKFGDFYTTLNDLNNVETILYWSPERLSKAENNIPYEYDLRMHVYSLGLTIFELANLMYPFMLPGKQTSASMVKKVITQVDPTYMVNYIKNLKYETNDHSLYVISFLSSCLINRTKMLSYKELKQNIFYKLSGIHYKRLIDTSKTIFQNLYLIEKFNIARKNSVDIVKTILMDNEEYFKLKLSQQDIMQMFQDIISVFRKTLAACLNDILLELVSNDIDEIDQEMLEIFMEAHQLLLSHEFPLVSCSNCKIFIYDKNRTPLEHIIFGYIPLLFEDMSHIRKFIPEAFTEGLVDKQNSWYVKFRTILNYLKVRENFIYLCERIKHLFETLHDGPTIKLKIENLKDYDEVIGKYFNLEYIYRREFFKYGIFSLYMALKISIFFDR